MFVLCADLSTYHFFPNDIRKSSLFHSSTFIMGKHLGLLDKRYEETNPAQHTLFTICIHINVEINWLYLLKLLGV